jgi:hypothetical protein
MCPTYMPTYKKRTTPVPPAHNEVPGNLFRPREKRVEKKSLVGSGGGRAGDEDI